MDIHKIEELLTASGYYDTGPVFNSIHTFMAEQEGAHVMTEETFVKFMNQRGIKPQYGRHYFRAFDINLDGKIDMRELLSGLIAMDPIGNRAISNNKIYLEHRLRMIFRVYDYKPPFGKLDPDEFTDLMRHMLRAAGRPISPEAVNLAIQRIAPSIGPADRKVSEIDVEMFLEAAKKGLLPDIDRVFRIPVSVPSFLSVESSSAGGSHSAPPGGSKEATDSTDTPALMAIDSGDRDGESTPAKRLKSDFLLSDTAFVVQPKGWSEAAPTHLAVSMSISMGDDEIIILPPESEADQIKVREHLARTVLRFLRESCTWTVCQSRPWAGATVKVLPDDAVKKSKFAVAIDKLCKAASSIMLHEKRCVEVQAPVYVVGDIHGNAFDLMQQFERYLWPLDPGASPGNFVFLGDYVDRGYNGPETVAYLLAMKILYPQKWNLLRGNHELRNVNDSMRMTGFKGQCHDRFGPEQGEMVWQSVNRCFDYMPFAAVIEESIFCVHGGIPMPPLESGEAAVTIEQLNAVPVPISLLGTDACTNLALGCLWADPCPTKHEGVLHASGFLSQAHIKPEDEAALDARQLQLRYIMFGQYAVNAFCETNSVSRIIRGHQAKAKGVEIGKEGRVLTVFSDSKDHGLGKKACSGCLLVERGRKHSSTEDSGGGTIIPVVFVAQPALGK